jgi:hypothetical protein
MPGLLKIGKTRRTVSKRMKELYDTGVPMPFKMEFNARVDVDNPPGKVRGIVDLDKVERDIHRLLSKYRTNNSREFFKLSVDEAFYLIDKYFYCEFTTMDEVLRDEDVSDEIKTELNCKYLKTFFKDAKPICIAIESVLYRLNNDKTLTFVASTGVPFTNVHKFILQA